MLRNDQALGHHWIRIKPVGKSANRDGIGVWVELNVDGVAVRRQVMPARSYLSQVELPITIGLGERERVDSVRVVWPGGSAERFENLGVDMMHTLEQGTGVAEG